MNTTSREATVLSLIPKSSIGGASISALGAMSHNEVVALAGFGITLLSFGINLFFQWKKDKRETVLHAARLSKFQKD